jgi:DNA invertase Pin-like site-specific DNA recombinase
MKFGYARVSSNTQDHAAQVEALKAAGCERIFSEKASGKSTNGRPEFARLIKTLRHGDVVTVVKLDRLARSSRDLQNNPKERTNSLARLNGRHVRPMFLAFGVPMKSLMPCH